MGESADELRRDIEQTRGDLTETLDAIGDRVSPGRVIERRKNRVVQSVQSARDRVMGSATNAGDSVTGTTSAAVDAVKGTPEIAAVATALASVGISAAEATGAADSRPSASESLPSTRSSPKSVSTVKLPPSSWVISTCDPLGSCVFCP